MMHVSLFSLFIDAVDSLRFAERSYGSNGKHLSLSSLEKTGAVSSRQYMSVTPDRTDFRAFSVIGTDTVVQDHLSYLFLCDGVKHIADILAVIRIDFFKMFFCFSFYSVHIVQTFHLVVSLDGSSHLVFCVFSDSSFDVFRNLIQFDFHLRLADFFYDFFDEFNDLLDFFMCEHDSVQDSIFRHFLCTCFYHHDRFFRSGNHQMHRACFPLF